MSISNTMTAKRTLTFLAGQTMIAKADRVKAGRNGSSTAKLDSLVKALEYASAAVFADKSAGKSSLKRGAAAGFVVKANK